MGRGQPKRRLLREYRKYVNIGIKKGELRHRIGGKIGSRFSEPQDLKGIMRCVRCGCGQRDAMKRPHEYDGIT